MSMSAHSAACAQLFPLFLSVRPFFFLFFFLTDKEAFYPLLLYITELPGVIVK